MGVLVLSAEKDDGGRGGRGMDGRGGGGGGGGTTCDVIAGMSQVMLKTFELELY